MVGPISSSSSHCGFPAVMVQKLELQVTINKTVITATGKEANTMIPLTSQHAAWLILTNGYKCNGQTVAAVLCYFQLLPTAPITVAKTNQPKPQSPEDKTSFHHRAQKWKGFSLGFVVVVKEIIFGAYNLFQNSA